MLYDIWFTAQYYAARGPQVDRDPWVGNRWSILSNAIDSTCPFKVAQYYPLASIFFMLPKTITWKKTEHTKLT